MRLPIAWLSHLPKNDHEAFKKTVTTVLRGKVIDRLKFLVNQKIEAAVLKEDDFDSPSWAFRRAYMDGKKIAYIEILQLMETKNE